MLPNTTANFNKRGETAFAFGGYYNDLAVPDGYFRDTGNISCDRCPVLTGRKPRRLLTSEAVSGICSLGGELYTVRNNHLYRDNAFVGAKTVTDTFVIEKTDRSASGTFPYGDLDGDGSVTENDASLALAIASGVKTAAQVYAESLYKQNGYPERAVSTAADIDRDGVISVTDALCILRTAAALVVPYNASRADLNGDGQVTSTDAFLCMEAAQGADAEEQLAICEAMALSGASSLSGAEIFSRAHVATLDGSAPITLDDAAAIEKYIADSALYALSDGEKQLVRFGSRLLIFPDKVYYDTLTREYGRLEASFEAANGVTAAPCTLDGAEITISATGATAPASPEDGDYWIDTSAGKVLKLWSGQEQKWVSVPTAYTKLAAEGIGRSFRIYDAVNIKLGNENPDAGDDAVNGNSYIIWGKGNDCLIIAAFADAVPTENGVAVKRIIPDMDFVCEQDNRLWGCRSETGEIFCSVQGDPSNFFRFLDVSSDGWAASVASDGAFTGCIPFDGSVLFFKEKTLHRVYGSRPSNYKVITSECSGVEASSGRSLAVVGGVLYYNSPRGIESYNSGFRFVGAPFGGERFTDACACAFENKYFVSMKSAADGEWKLFVCDTEKALWVKEDGTQARFMTEHGGDLIFTSELVGGRLLCSEYGKSHCFPGAVPEDAPEWYAETGDLLASPAPDKHLHGLQLRFRVPTGGSLKLYAAYDGGEPRRVWAEEATGRIVCRDIPLEAERADYCRLKLVCRGDCEIYALTRIYSL